MHEIICPDCGSQGTLVSVERVYQTFGVFYTEAGALEFDGHVVSSWDGEDNGIQCTKCSAEFSRGNICNTDQAKELRRMTKEEE